MRHSLPLFLAALTLNGTAHAIVSMEDLHTGAPREGLSGNAALSLSTTSGNTEKEDYALGSRLQWHSGAVTDYLILRGAYGESGGVKNTENSFLHARHMYNFRPRHNAELFVQAEQDTFARLDFRGLAGLGARYTIFERESVGVVHFGLGAFYSRERIDDSYPDGGTESLWRTNSYLVLKYQLSENAVLGSTTYYQPAMGDSHDFRALEQAGLKVKINDTLSLTLSYDLRYDSEPPIGVERRDTTTATTLSLEF